MPRVQPATILAAVNRWILYAIIFFAPLTFGGRMSDAFELPKQSLLLVGVVLVTTLWLARMVLEQKFQWLPVRGWGWIVAFFVAAIASTVMSVHPFTSLLGDYGQEWGSLATMIAVALIGLVALQELNEQQWLGALFALLLSSLVTSVLFLLGIAGVFVLPWEATRTALFTPAGDIVGLAVFSAITLILASAKFFILGLGEHGSLKNLQKAGHSAVSVLLLATIVTSMGVIAVIGIKLIWVVVAVSELLLYMIIIGRAQELTKTHRWVVVFAVIVVAAFFVMIPARLVQRLPPILIMSWSESRTVVQETLKDSPVFGSGPSTFSIDVNKYHTAEALRQSFGVLFDRSRSSLWTHLAQLGIVATVLGLLFWLFAIIVPMLKAVFRHAAERRWLILITLGSGWTVGLALLALLPTTILLEFVFGLLTAGLLWALAPSATSKTWDLADSPRLRMTVLSVACIVFLSAPLLTWASYRRIAADWAFLAARDQRAGLDDRRAAIARAINLYPWSDVYFRTVGALQLAKFQDTLQNKKDSEERMTQLRLLARDTIVAGREATRLNLVSAANWQALAGLYQQLSPFVEGAEDEAIKSLEKLRELEPNNPTHVTDLAAIYVTRADREGAAGEKANQKKISDALIDAEDLLKKALQLDEGFASAHFQMAIIEERRGKLSEAIKRVEGLSRTRPGDLPLHIQLGALYYKNNQKDLAEKVWNAVIAAKSDYANARWYLAQLYEDQKRYDDELSELNEILKNNANNPQLMKKIEEVTKLATEGGRGTTGSSTLKEKIPLPEPPVTP
ncbi:tetratricopeptide repeat protein [Candidatus Uhrbacteria bacterium]|nr:tetratricopeptide repeat protein [Candidatus Uhrbacteria bacterium]